MARKLVGIRRWKSGWQAYVKIGGKPHAKSFPIDTPIATMRKWREDEIDEHAAAPAAGAPAGSFAADVATYLTRVGAMPSYKQRAAHLALWTAALGRDRKRAGITPAEIDAVLQEWLLAGCAPATVRKRRTALQSLFVKLDGKHAKNPVKATENPRPPKAELRGLDYGTIARILDAMPAWQSAKPGAVQKPACAKSRAAVIAYTGIPPKTLQGITRSDLNLEAATVRARPRRKGQGVSATTLPLTPEGVAAFRAFDKADAYGRFAVQSLNRSFQRACTRVGVDAATVSLYDLRHSFGAELYRVTRDLATVGRFLLHSEGSPITARYAKAANEAVDQAAAAQLGAALASARAAVAEQETAARVSPQVVPSRKARVLKHLRKAS